LEIDIPNPQDPYAISKYEAEQGLLKLTKNSSFEVVLIRPPLVYGNNAPGNFSRLIQWASAKFILPLPLGAVNNARSLIAIDNLVSFIIICSLHSKSANEIFLISDDDNLSTTKLLKKVARVFNKKAILLPVPVNWIIFLAKLFGKKADAVRLFSSLVVDSSKARDLLDWHPVTTMDEQLFKITENEESI
jgi:nucleoside-diphosphate-sugar epimerase